MNEVAYMLVKLHYLVVSDQIHDHFPENGRRVAAVLHTKVQVQFSTALLNVTK